MAHQRDCEIHGWSTTVPQAGSNRNAAVPPTIFSIKPSMATPGQLCRLAFGAPLTKTA